MEFPIVVHSIFIMSFVLFEISLRVTVMSAYLMASGGKKGAIIYTYKSFTILSYEHILLHLYTFCFISRIRRAATFLISEDLFRLTGHLKPCLVIYTPGVSFRKQRSYYVIYLEFHSGSAKSLSLPNVPLLYCPFFYLMSLLLFNILFMYTVS